RMLRSPLPLFCAASAALLGCSSDDTQIEGADAVLARFRGIAQSGDVVGATNAPVTMSEFGDLQCPYCQHFDIQALPTLIDRYVRPGKVRLEFFGIAILGPDSERAARMANAVGLQNHLWEFVDLFYVNQRDENSDYVNDDFLRAVASNVHGVDVDRALADRSSTPVEAALAHANNE